MVSLEEEMKQKDKEAAVLKANHKYEMLLNIELERIEKCKRTYENFHNFEVAVMKERHNRILQKQCELKVQKNLSKVEITELQQGYQRSKSQSKERANVDEQYNNNQTNSGRTFNHARETADGTNVTESLAHLKNNSNYTVVPAASEHRQRLNLQQVQYTSVVQYANNVRTLTNVPVIRVTNKQNSERDYFHKNSETSNTENVVKFPVLQTLSSSDKSPTTENSGRTTNTLQRHTHFSENLTETHVIQSRDVRTPLTVSRMRKKKSHRAANEDNLSPFDQYRLRLQESEQRTRKPKHHFTRAISAIDSNTGRNIEDTLTAVRRARSADVQ